MVLISQWVSTKAILQNGECVNIATICWIRPVISMVMGSFVFLNTISCQVPLYWKLKLCTWPHNSASLAHIQWGMAPTSFSYVSGRKLEDHSNWRTIRKPLKVSLQQSGAEKRNQVPFGSKWKRSKMLRWYKICLRTRVRDHKVAGKQRLKEWVSITSYALLLQHTHTHKTTTEGKTPKQIGFAASKEKNLHVFDIEEYHLPFQQF